MSLRLLVRSAVLVVTALLVACSSSVGGTGGGGEGGTTSTGSGGSTGSSTSTSGGCQGDPAAWAQLTAGPISCVSNADCCVVVNSCVNSANIVSATNQAAAKAAMDTCGPCTDCIPPAIQVGCDNGVCVGRSVDLADAGPELMQDHCGVDLPTGFTPGKLAFSCGG